MEPFLPRDDDDKQDDEDDDEDGDEDDDVLDLVSPSWSFSEESASVNGVCDVATLSLKAVASLT